MEIASLVTKLLGPPEEFNGTSRNPTRLCRWTIFGNKRFNVYLHHSFGDDWNENLVRHPKRFISVGLVRSCLENAAMGIDIPPDRATWMVLIGRPALNRKDNRSD